MKLNLLVLENEDMLYLLSIDDDEAYTYDDEVIKKAEAMEKPENPEEEATVETTSAIKHHQES
ncbi:hypothetical protein HN51_003287 [Arachis hypogaea]